MQRKNFHAAKIRKTEFSFNLETFESQNDLHTMNK